MFHSVVAKVAAWASESKPYAPEAPPSESTTFTPPAWQPLIAAAMSGHYAGRGQGAGGRGGRPSAARA